MNVQQFDVVIVGLGTVGASAAQALGRYGLRTAVFEHATDLDAPTTMVHCDEYTRTFWHSLGITPHFTECDGLTVCQPNRRVVAQFPAQTNAFPARIACTAVELSSLLQQNLFRYPTLSLFTGCRVELITKLEDSVTVMARRGDGTAVTVSAQYLIGCDGANSLSRIMAGIGIYKSDVQSRWLLIETKTVNKQPSADWQIICHLYRPAMSVPGAAGQTQWAVALRPDEPLAEMNTPAVAQRLLAEFVSPVGEIVATQTVSSTAWQTTAWRNGRLFIAGSAAHQFPFWPGLNLSQSIRDIANLAWRLNLVIRHQADPALLDGYEAERAPEVRQMMETAVQLTRLAQQDPHIPVSTIEFATPNPLPPALVRTEAGQIATLDTLPQGEFVLVGVGVAPQSLLSPDDLAWLDTLHAQYLQVTDLEGALRDYQNQVLLVRPDGLWWDHFSARQAASAMVRWQRWLGGATAVPLRLSPALQKRLLVAAGAVALAGAAVGMGYFWHITQNLPLDTP